MLPTPPPTTLRYNPLCGRSPDEVLKNVLEELGYEVDWYGRGIWDMMLLKSGGCNGKSVKSENGEKVWVDRRCGEAVLRGADIFAPGVVAMGREGEVGDVVDVWVDVGGRVTRGSLRFHDGCGGWWPEDGDAVFVGKGVVVIGRNGLWPKGREVVERLRGVAVRMIERVFDGPPISGRFGGDVYAMNLPSAVVGHVLKVEKGMFVVDLCASPGGKTGHVAGLLEEGRVVAFDKSERKVRELRKNMERLNAEFVECYAGNSAMYRKYLKSYSLDDVKPKYGVLIEDESADRVVVDPPCSALGIRPRLKIEVESVKELEKHAAYQRLFLKAAVKLCKVGGLICFSTCTINPLENEGNVKWMLDTFPVRLVDQEPRIGGFGRMGAGLEEKNCRLLQRFDPSPESDTAGFFIALFEKVSS